jgi:hypothetical protein
MKIHHFEKEISPLGFFAHESWSGAAELMRGLLTRSPDCGSKVSYWQLILLQSKANGCFYHDKDLPQNNWAWPKDTWFQERLSRHLSSNARSPDRKQEAEIV